MTFVLFEIISYSVKHPKCGQKLTSQDPHGADIQNSDGKRSIAEILASYIRVCLRISCVDF